MLHIYKIIKKRRLLTLIAACVFCVLIYKDAAASEGADWIIQTVPAEEGRVYRQMGVIDVHFDRPMNPLTGAVWVEGGGVTDGQWNDDNTVYSFSYIGLALGYHAWGGQGFESADGTAMNSFVFTLEATDERLVNYDGVPERPIVSTELPEMPSQEEMAVWNMSFEEMWGDRPLATNTPSDGEIRNWEVPYEDLWDENGLPLNPPPVSEIRKWEVPYEQMWDENGKPLPPNEIGRPRPQAAASTETPTTAGKPSTAAKLDDAFGVPQTGLPEDGPLLALSATLIGALLFSLRWLRKQF
jgi:hypothetical protein